MIRRLSCEEDEPRERFSIKLTPNLTTDNLKDFCLEFTTMAYSYWLVYGDPYGALNSVII
jgi:hypothetical protein